MANYLTVLKSCKLALLSVLAISAFSFGCQTDRTQGQDAANSIVLDTSSPDEPRIDAANEAGISAVAKNLVLHASDSNQTIANKNLQGSSYTGPIVVSSAKDSLTKIVYQRWVVANDIAAGQNAKWGVLLYNEEDCQYVNVTVRGIKAEHAIYQHSPRGNVLLKNVVVLDVGAQGFQQVWRGGETSDPLGYLKVGTHRIENSSFTQCGQPRGYGRASYAISMFGRQAVDGSSPRQMWNCPVELDGVTIEHDSKGAYELRGALLAEWRPSLTIKNSRINYVGTADRDLAHIHEITDVRIENSYIHSSAGKYVDIDGDVHSVVITSIGDGGDARVRINGNVVGTTDDEIVWHN